MFKKTHLCSAILIAFGGTAFAQDAAPATDPNQPQATQRVEITGSRIKRAETEGSLPVTVITREQLDKSGAVTVAEFVRNTTFASAGNFRPQSGSSAQSFAGMDLRGLGSSRTLVLIDGRRAPVAPNVGDSADMNAIPMAAVERIEILTDGASAVYGSDAIGGVINVILRKDYEGVDLKVGFHNPANAGGDRTEYSAMTGIRGDKGNMIAGVSRTTRDMVFTSQRPWGDELGVSSFGNNYFTRAGGLAAVPGGCTEPNFWMTSGGTCSYNFNAVAAEEASITNTAFFARGEYQINDDWSAYLTSSVSRIESFGRYAPSLAQLTVTSGSPNDFLNDGDDITIRHRFAALGNRDNDTEANVYDVQVGARGNIGYGDVEFGVRQTTSKYFEFGRNYVVIPIATQYVADGTYNIFNPSSNPEEVLSAMKATITRDGTFRRNEAYGSFTTDLFQMGGGAAGIFVQGEVRNEFYADIYDSLSEAGVIGGSAGNSSSGKRKVGALSGEFLMPFTKELELSLAARFEKYNDYGNDFSPKASIKFQPMPELALRASVGTGFRAPSLNILHQKTTYSADFVVDPATCEFFGGDPVDCQTAEIQVDTFYQANPTLKSEKSRQFSFGFTVDPVNWLSVTADYWNINLRDTISSLGAATLVDRANGTSDVPIPAGLGVIRGPSGEITRVNAGFANEGTLKTSGIDLNFLAQYNLGEWGKFRHELLYSRVLKYNLNDTDVLGDAGLPKHRAQLSNNWSWGDLALAWNINMVGSNGEESPPDPVFGDDGVQERVGSYVTHDVQIDWDTPIKGGKLTLGVVNLTNKMPAQVEYDGRVFNFYLYDSYGRTPYVRFTQKF